MRFTDRITFVTETEGGYNPDTGNFDDAVLIKQTLPCNLSPLGIERTATLFGDVDTEITVARLQQPYQAAFDHVEVNGQRLKVKRHIPHRRESVFYLEGVIR